MPPRHWPPHKWPTGYWVGLGYIYITSTLGVHDQFTDPEKRLKDPILKVVHGVGFSIMSTAIMGMFYIGMKY